MPILLKRIEKANDNFPDYQYEFQLTTDEAKKFRETILVGSQFIDLDKASEEHDVRVKVTFVVEMFKKQSIETLGLIDESKIIRKGFEKQYNNMEDNPDHIDGY